MKITYYIHDLSFPVIEGTRKQCWLLAKAMKKEGNDIIILSTSKKSKKIIKDGIIIQYGNPIKISKNAKTDIMHYISHPSPLLLPLLLRVKAKKQIMSIFGGNIHGFWKRKWDIIVSNIIKQKIDIITLQTKFQYQLIKQTRLKNIQTELIAPLIPKLKRTKKRNKNPTLLFMSHLSQFKGIGIVLNAFQILRKQIKNLKLVICDSGLNNKNKYYKKIKEINQDDIILKGKVNPSDELSKAWVYLYPITQVQETFSVPLSLIESLQIKTPYICSDVGGISEYFDTKTLINPKNVNELIEKITYSLKSKSIKMKKEINNKKTIQRFKSIYLK